MEGITPVVHGLESAQIEQFITDGFVRIDRAFPRERANAARAILWRATGCDPDDPDITAVRANSPATAQPSPLNGIKPSFIPFLPPPRFKHPRWA